MPATTVAPSDRVAELLAPGTPPGHAGAGYLDLLDPEPQVPTGLTQRLMESGVVPQIYERWWRPALGRVFKGPTGPGIDGEHAIAREMLELRPGERVLDLACGPGNFTRDFGTIVAPRGLAVGIDASTTMLARAVRDTPPGADVAYVRGDAIRLPFADGSFDAVCCFAALHIFGEPLVALDHVARVLRRGGRVAIFTSCARGPGPAAALARAGGGASGMHVFGPDEVTGALEARGFTDVRRRLAGLTQFVGARRA